MALNQFKYCEYEVERVWREFVYVEGRKQRNGREDKKFMMIASYARYTRLPAGSVAGLLQEQQ